MKHILFIDIEVGLKGRKLSDIGGINDSGHSFHSSSLADFERFIDHQEYIGGHNILKHDIPLLERLSAIDFSGFHIIDTLYLSPLLYPKEPYHSLVKDDKLQTDELNNPLNDAIKARDLFYDEVAAFNELDADLKQIFFSLLKEFPHFLNSLVIHYLPPIWKT